MTWNINILDLPNELLIHILTPFATRELLHLATISHRFHDIVLRLLHHRLLAAAALENHKLIFECFLPSAQYSTPGLPCDYLGTDGLHHSIGGGDHSSMGTDSLGKLSRLHGLYSRFRPKEPEGKQRRRRHPAGDVPGHPNTSTSQDWSDTQALPTQAVYLEHYELFSQLRVIANLVKLGPKRGLFMSCVTIGEGVLRIFREWLSNQVATKGDISGKRNEAKSGILWLDDVENVGVRIRATEMRDTEVAPILQEINEDSSVTYLLEYKELMIRTTQLLLKIEEALHQETSASGKALIIGNWRED